MLDLIQRTGGIEYEGINRNWWENYRLNETHEPLPKRTLQNHIKAIYDMFGIEIESTRPFYSVLSKESIKQDFGIKIAHWENGLKRCLNEMEKMK